MVRDVDRYLRSELSRHGPIACATGPASSPRQELEAVLSAAAAAFVVIVSLVVFYTVRLAAARNAAVAEAVRTHHVSRGSCSTSSTAAKRKPVPPTTSRVVTLVDRGRLQAQSLDREPLGTGGVYQTLGGIYQRLGKFDQADALLKSSLDARRVLLGPDAADVVKGLVALGLLRSDQAQFDEAERLVRPHSHCADETACARTPRSRPRRRRSERFSKQRNAYDGSLAIKVLEEAARLQSSAGADQAELASTLFELASTHFYAGHYDVAESLTQRVLTTMHRQRFGQRHPLVAEDLINLGAIQHERGRYAEAERFYREALDITQPWYGKDSYWTASNLTMLARGGVRGQGMTRPRPCCSRRLRFTSTSGRVHPRVASALNDLGNVAMKRGRADDAEPYFRRIGEIHRQVRRQALPGRSGDFQPGWRLHGARRVPDGRADVSRSGRTVCRGAIHNT